MDATAIITGGSGGLGVAVVDEFIAAGWRVVVPWIEEKELKRLPDLPHLVTVQADLSDPESAQEVAALAAGSPRAPLRAVVNLVGGFAAGGRVHETPIEEFEQLLRLNLRPLYLTTQAALPEMISIGGGTVVCVSSRSAIRPFPGAAGYVTGKAAVLALADTLAVEYAKNNIRVNTVVPERDRHAWQPGRAARCGLLDVGRARPYRAGRPFPVRGLLRRHLRGAHSRLRQAVDFAGSLFSRCCGTAVPMRCCGTDLALRYRCGAPRAHG